MLRKITLSILISSVLLTITPSSYAATKDPAKDPHAVLRELQKSWRQSYQQKTPAPVRPPEPIKHTTPIAIRPAPVMPPAPIAMRPTPIKPPTLITTRQTPATNKYDTLTQKFIADPRWKPGITYNGRQKPKLSGYKSTGCCAFAADFVKYVYGKNSPRDGGQFSSVKEIRTGDVIVFSSPSHWVIVLNRSGNSLHTLEGNWMNGKVERSNTAYTIKGKTILRDGKKFRTFSLGYHFR